MDKDEPQIPTEPRPAIEGRSLTQALGTVALGAGVGFAGQVGALGAQDAYEKIKEVVRPSDDTPKIILPPGTSDE